MSSKLLRPALVAALFLALSPPVLAVDRASEAERVRLSEEMHRLARRSAWQGVEDAFEELVKLAERGVPVPASDYLLGAEAARNLGDIQAAWERLVEARKLKPTPEITGRIEAIEANYGRVTLSADSRYVGDTQLAPAEMPFAADQRKAITYAQGRIMAERSFTGMLPAGDYTFGPRSFTVTPGAGPVVVKLTEADGIQKEKGLAFVGPRVDVGPAFTVAGQPSYHEGELHPDGFSGVGARAGVGLELGMHSGFGALVEVGWHGAFGGRPDLAEDPAYEADGSSLNLGFGWLAGTWRTGDFGLALGPVLAAGMAKSTGLSEYCSNQSCPGIDASDPSALQYQSMSGSIVSFGGSLGASIGFLDIGGLQLGAGVQLGAQSDSARLYPWGQLGLTLAPKRSDG